MLLTSKLSFQLNSIISDLAKINQSQVRNLLFNYDPASSEVIDVLNEIAEAYGICLEEIKKVSNILGVEMYSPQCPKYFRLLINARCVNKEKGLYKEIQLLRSRSCINELDNDDRENAIKAAVLIREAAAALLEEVEKLK